MKLSECMRILRKEKHISQEDVAAALDLSLSAYCRYEQGKREPTVSVLERMADYYNVSADYLLGRSDSCSGQREETPAKELECRIYPANSLPDLKYVVVCSRRGKKWMLSKHKKRASWETQGGHIENGESPLDAAKRELFEESGVKRAELYYVCDYVGLDSTSASNGAVFFARIHELGEMPESEMETAKLFDTLPANLTYPQTTPQLIRQAEVYALEHGLM